MKSKEAISRRRFLDATGKTAVAAACCALCPAVMAQAPSDKDKAASPSAGQEEKKKAVYYGACGMYCGACPTLMKSEKADKPEDIVCLGCMSEKLNPMKANCELRKCAKAKNVQACSLCKAYPCEKTKKFFATKDALKEANEKNLGVIKEKGVTKWLEEQKARWTCPKCGARVSYRDKKCPKCGATLNSID